MRTGVMGRDRTFWDVVPVRLVVGALAAAGVCAGVGLRVPGFPTLAVLIYGAAALGLMLFGLVGSGALGFLALIDISFNLTHGLYAPTYLSKDGGLRMEVIINISCAVGAFWSIWRFWGHPLRRADDRARRETLSDATRAAGEPAGR